MRKIRYKKFWILLFLIALVYANNSSLLTEPIADRPLLLAHRGLGQTFPMEGITGETNTAQRIYVPEHDYIENTIPSMEAAFAAGADIVELDVHPTKDGKFIVFHDWILDYRTDGEGVTREQTVEQLKNLDVGYGYTADNGQTFPFRGQGIGLMPTLNEVFERFPNQSFLIHIKSNDASEGLQLAAYLQALPDSRLEQITVYGGAKPIDALKEQVPNLRVMSMETIKEAIIPYFAIGWTGYIPPAMRDTQLHLPLRYARLLWGWPNKFLQRMDDANTRVIVVAGDGQWSEGFDTAADLDLLPENYAGGIWTNRIDRIGPLLGL